MRTAITPNGIRVETEALYANVTGRKGFSAGEADIVVGSIIDAYQLVLLEYGVGDFVFHETSDTKTITAGTNYVDLDEYVFRVIPGTVRIASERITLSSISEASMLQSDPNLEVTGIPTGYIYGASDDPDIIRLTLWPNPDAAYTLSFNSLIYPADDINNFPIAVHGAIKNKSKELSCIGLGIPHVAGGFKVIYDEMIAKIKDSYAGAPTHIGRSIITGTSRGIESRIRS